MSYATHLAAVRSVNDRFRYYKSIESLFELDAWSALPAEGGAYRQQMAALVAEQKAALFREPDAQAAAAYFQTVDLRDIEDDIARGLIRTFRFRYRNATRTPADLTRSYSLIRADAMNKWKEAREKQDFRVFQPLLEQVFELKKQIALAIDPDAPAFDTLVGLTDEGARNEEISREFGVLAEGLQPLLARIRASKVALSSEPLSIQEDPARVEQFARRLAIESGYKLERGSINNQVIHGFSSFLGPRDARFSTQSAGTFDLIFTYLHEAGHAMYASGGSDAVNAANMWGGVEGGFHEAMARFNENIIGRSKAYWTHCYPLLQQEFPVFAGVSLDEFYRAMNTVRPSLRRIAADEVTYSLHVILRYEIERDYFAGKLSVADLPEVWNDLSERYLGIRPTNDTEGVLQDMHWAGDYIGYFQSYALGNIYGGQLLSGLRRDVPTLDNDLAHGSFDRLNAWLDENIRQHGCVFTASELVQRVSGSTLDAKPFLAYLTDKYSDLYEL